MPSIYEEQQAQQGGGNFLQKLRNMVSPTSTAGMLGNQDAYANYVQSAIANGQQPVSRMEFLQMMQSRQGGGQGRMPGY